MTKVLRILLVPALALALFSCSPRGETVIPPSRFKAIYREMLLADQWLEYHPEAQTRADTSLFYEGIFRKYGYTLSDYQHSVTHYLSDPRRYGRIVKSVAKEISSERQALAREEEAYLLERHKADSIAELLSAYRPAILHLLTEFMDKPYRRDTILFGETSEGVRFPSGVAPVDRFRGPEVLFLPEEAAPEDKADTLTVDPGATRIDLDEIRP